MNFERIPRVTRLLDPRKDYAETRIESEMRMDPLTGFSGRIAHFAAGPWPTMDLEALNQTSLSQGCPFCPDMVNKVTPKFPEEITSQGRFRQGEAIVFPNLSPYDAHSAVTVITEAHLVPVNKFSAQHWEDALGISIEYFRAVRHYENHIGYGLIGANYMPMAGASLLHPHLQIYATDRPGNWLKSQIEASQRYYNEHAHIFWQDLIEAEKSLEERYLASTGTVEWIVPFVPLSFIGDVEAIFPRRFTILDLTPEDIAAFSQGLLYILHYMKDTNIYSFNLAFYPGQSEGDRTWVHARISFRGMINPVLHSPDVSVIRQLLDEPFTTVYPEKTARELKPYFSSL
ncbi:MAG: hypothetical protein M1596_00460 [Firmicutes bacterium]|nr:hypothetical protein [Bacillota bacterium]